MSIPPHCDVRKEFWRQLWWNTTRALVRERKKTGDDQLSLRKFLESRVNSSSGGTGSYYEWWKATKKAATDVSALGFKKSGSFESYCKMVLDGNIDRNRLLTFKKYFHNVYWPIERRQQFALLTRKEQAALFDNIIAKTNIRSLIKDPFAVLDYGLKVIMEPYLKNQYETSIHIGSAFIRGIYNHISLSPELTSTLYALQELQLSVCSIMQARGFELGVHAPYLIDEVCRPWIYHADCNRGELVITGELLIYSCLRHDGGGRRFALEAEEEDRMETFFRAARAFVWKNNIFADLHDGGVVVDVADHMKDQFNMFSIETVDSVNHILSLRGKPTPLTDKDAWLHHQKRCRPGDDYAPGMVRALTQIPSIKTRIKILDNVEGDSRAAWRISAKLAKAQCHVECNEIDSAILGRDLIKLCKEFGESRVAQYDILAQLYQICAKYFQLVGAHGSEDITGERLVEIYGLMANTHAVDRIETTREESDGALSSSKPSTKEPTTHAQLRSFVRIPVRQLIARVRSGKEILRPALSQSD